MQTKIALISKDSANVKKLEGFIQHYQITMEKEIGVKIYDNELELFNRNEGVFFDIAIIDVALEKFPCQEYIRKLYSINPHIKIVLMGPITQAIIGYEVDAVGYFAVPLEYKNVFQFMDKAIKASEKENDKLFSISLSGKQKKRINLDDLKYVEIYGHNLVYHLTYGKECGIGVLSDLENKLIAHGFIRCNKSMLVNINFISSVNKEGIYIDDQLFTITRGRKKYVMQQLTFAFEHKAP